MKRIAIVATTDRPGSNTLRFANYLKPLYESNGAKADVISLQDFPIEKVIGGKYGKDIPEVKAFNDSILNNDGIVFVIPEYNGSFPGIFKLFIDYLPFPESFSGMPVAFVGLANGSFGALRAVEQAQHVAGYRNAYVFPERVFIAQFHKQFSDDKGLHAELQEKLLRSQVRNFISFVGNTFPKQNLD
ncbi:MAG: NAD(P)H-dependent oxidoreductase [Bacteroidetes bacterium]|nr:NAD(P)H-dependent oxidoreductase [Bacteroidota bacterium]MCH8524422.1 NAD(P)H-dependent oxidoreductase [Balneolales bacterium]